MTTWVLLRGLMRESRHWGAFRDLFQAAMAGHRIVTLDFPGNGSLYEQQSLTSVAAMADHCHAQLRRLNCTPPYRVMALSLGAMVAVAWNRQYPGDLEKLVLISTSLAPYNPFYQRLRPENYVAMIRFLLDDTGVQREQLILRLTSVKFHPGILKLWTGYAREYPVSRANILRQLLAASRYRAVSPSVPVLLLAGQQDSLVDVQCSRTLAEHWGCEIHLHPAAGHDLPLDEPVWVTQQVVGWLASLDVKNDEDSQAVLG